MSAATEPGDAIAEVGGAAVADLPPLPFATDDSLITELLGSSVKLPAAWRLLRSSCVILLTDVAAVALAIALSGSFDRGTVAYLVLLPAWLGLLGSYRPRVSPSIQTDLIPLLGALACPMLVLVWIETPLAEEVLHDVPLTAIAVVVGRACSYSLRRWARARTLSAERTIIVGSGVLGCQVARVLLDHPEYGMLPVGFIDGFPDDGTLPLPLLGKLPDFDELVRRAGAVRVIVAFGADREADLVEVLRASVEAHVEMHIIPRLFELGVTPTGPDTDLIWGFPLQHARRAALRSPAWKSKRIADVVLSSLMLILASPVMVAAALAVRLSGPGPVLFRQRRLGQRGEVVEILKFRSMRVNADADIRWGGSTSDDRITPVGRLLRATSVDELPQIINVFKGDMSLVGPRPERPHFADQFDHQIIGYRDRLRVPVGLTGWAQIHGLRGDTSIEERARFDNYYIEHWSLWFDAVILTRTALYVVREVVSTLMRRS